ncbi:MAG TPA: TolC family protein [Desulfuromonadales bacterium]|nr:TolC family protein [Desulfuromonadales bacterium]
MRLFAQILVVNFLTVTLSPISLHALPEVAEEPQNQAPAPLKLTLNAAITMAIQKNIDLRIEGQNSKMASVDAVKSKGIYDPILNASATAGASKMQGLDQYSSKNLTTSAGVTQYLPTGGNISATTQTGYFKYEPALTASKDWQSSATLALSQPLLKNAGQETFELNITLSSTTQKESLERFRSATADTVYNVITSYNRLYVQQRILNTRKAALASAREILEGAKNKDRALLQGIGIADAEFAIDQRTKDFFEATRSVEEQETYLRYLIGLETADKIIPTDAPSKSEPLESFEQAVGTAVESRPDMKQLKSGLESARLLERIAKHQALPELTVNAGGGVVGSGFNSGDSYRELRDNPTKNWNVGVQFTIPLGNTTPGNEYVKSKIRTEQAQDQVKALSWRIRNEIKNDMNALVSARLQMYMTEKASRSAEQRYEQYVKNNRLNQASVQDVLNAENDMNNSRNSQMEAVETFSNAVSKIWKDTGVLLDRHNVMIDVSQPIAIAKKEASKPASVVILPVKDIQLTDIPAALAAIPAQKTLPGAAVTPTNDPPHASASLSQTVPPVKTVVPRIIQSTTPLTSVVPKRAPVTEKTYTLLIGEFTDTLAMAEAVEKIQSIGLNIRKKDGGFRTEQVIRLYVTEFVSRSQAETALKKLLYFTADGFIVSVGKKRHVLYAGKYFDQNDALNDQSRLEATGITVTLEKMPVSLPLTVLTAGNFLDSSVAQNFLKKLERLDLKAVVKENL